MSIETLEEDLRSATAALLKLAQHATYKSISDNCLFIISEIKDGEGNIHVQRQLRKERNNKKIPHPLEELLPQLLDLYSNFYDINLYVYKALKHKSIIEIVYYPKSSLDEDYRKTVINNEPMLHCKVAVPSYASDNKEKFDINWEHRPFHHRWKMFWWKRKIDKELKSYRSGSYPHEPK